MKHSLLKWYLLLPPIYMAFTAVAQENNTAKELFKVTGTVYAAPESHPLPGASILVEGTTLGTVSNETGMFEISLAQGNYQLKLSYLGYDPKTIAVEVPLNSPLSIQLSASELILSSVEIVSTGYQKLPKERATGSFAHVNQELLSRRVSPNLLDRLEDVTPGLVFNRGEQGVRDPISIRGRNTLFANTSPLIVVDNFPYDGDLDNINPNDVESVTVLKDAAAASIWGARAGNGVIVITTKSGAGIVGKPQITFNSNWQVHEKPDPFYPQVMTINDRINIEEMLFNNGYYNSRENSGSKIPLPPAVEILIAERDGKIPEKEADKLISEYRNQDLRSELSDHYYRPSFHQQYAFGIRGQNKTHTYSLSLGYDGGEEGIVGNRSNRITMGLNNQWDLSDQKLSIRTGVYLSSIKKLTKSQLPSAYPYEILADSLGNPLPVTGNFSTRYISSIAESGLLDWQYVPLNEIGLLEDKSTSWDGRFRFTGNYRVNSVMNVELGYQYWINKGDRSYLRPLETYFTRDLINQYTQIEEDGSLSRPIPVGDILDVENKTAQAHNLRGLIRFDKTWQGLHDLNAIAGMELRDGFSESYSHRFYGYDDELGISIPVDYTNSYRRYQNPGQTTTILSNEGHSGTTDRFISYFANVAYNYSGKYSITFSARKDQSNLFGVEANQRGVPLWSTGIGWLVSEDPFYKLDWMPYLKLRGTYGYNGNIDKSVTSMTTASFYISRFFDVLPNVPTAVITNPPNPNLRWERIRIINFGLDFASKSDRLNGSVEYYQKAGLDLIGDTPMPTSRGVRYFRGNFASTLTKGWDIALNSLNLDNNLKWHTNFIYSYTDEKITSYERQSTVTNYLNSSFSANVIPLEGKPLYAIYAIPWGGLDPDNGDPRGVLDGEPSSNYSTVINSLTPESLEYHGPARPVHSGAIRNTFKWRDISLSFNISYRLGYYYRRHSVEYGDVLNGRGSHADYASRWQNPGDEQYTDVPSMPDRVNSYRDRLYLNSSALVEKGDHIRLQDVRLSYTLDRSRIPVLPFQRAEIYSYANNLGILWKASDDPLDPDFRTMRPLRSIALGLRVEF